jgi:hypothetical protein
MDLNRLLRRAKKVVDDRGGTGALKEDVEELRNVARSHGSVADKAKAAAAAVKDPGAPGEERPEGGRPEAPGGPGHGI